MLTNTVFLCTVAIIGGISCLVWSADRFVQSSVSLAQRAGLSTFVIGMTVVAFGTSAPEILVSITSALSGSPTLAVGNAIGSNIANLGLVLGLTALIAPVPIHQEVRKQELPILLVTTLLCGPLFLNHYFGTIDAITLLAYGLCLLLFFLFKKKPIADSEHIHTNETSQASHGNLTLTLIWFISALVLLLISSRLLVWGATGLAHHLSVNEALIGLTVVAIGTSLPELAAAIACALKRQLSLALGNVIGSNILNLLLVLPWPGLLAPSTLPVSLRNRDFSTMLALTLLLTAITLLSRKQQQWQVTRVHGFLFLLSYSVYITILGIQI